MLDAAVISRSGSLGSRNDLLDIVRDLLQRRVIIEGAARPSDKILLPKFNINACLCSRKHVVASGKDETERDEQPDFREHGER